MNKRSTDNFKFVLLERFKLFLNGWTTILFSSPWEINLRLNWSFFPIRYWTFISDCRRANDKKAPNNRWRILYRNNYFSDKMTYSFDFLSRENELLLIWTFDQSQFLLNVTDNHDQGWNLLVNLSWEKECVLNRLFVSI